MFIVGGQTHLSGFAQNDLSSIDEASSEVFSLLRFCDKYYCKMYTWTIL